MIESASCDMEDCGTVMRTENGDEIYVVSGMYLCEDCYSERYSDLTEEYLEEEDE